MSANLAGLIAILMWSISPLLVIGTGDIPPFMMSASALLLTALLLFCQSSYKKHSWRSIFVQPVKAYLITFYGIGGYTIFWFLGFKNAPPFEANTLNYLWPILLVCFTHFFTKERLSLSSYVGIGLGFIGTALLFNNGYRTDFSTQHFMGYIFALLGAVIWASYSTATRFISFPQRAMAVFMLIPGLFFLLLHIIYEPLYKPQISEALFLIAIGLTRISFVFWDYAMKHGQIKLISSLAYFIPCVSTALLMIFGFTAQNNMILFSAGLVIVGCLIVNSTQIHDALKKRLAKA